MDKSNDIIIKILLDGHKFMLELHLWDSKIKKYSACGRFTKHTQINYKNELDKACFQHDMAYNKYKDLKGRTQSDIALKNKAFKIAINSRYDGFQ